MKSFRHFQEDVASSRGALSATTSGSGYGGNEFQTSQQDALSKKVTGITDTLGKLGKKGIKKILDRPEKVS